MMKLTEPNSVVMPSEFLRAGINASLWQQVSATWDRWREGGAPLPLPELEKQVETARQTLANLGGFNEGIRSAIRAAIAQYHIPEVEVFGTPDPTFGGPPPAIAQPATPPVMPPGITQPPVTQPVTPGGTSNFYQDAQGNWVIRRPGP
jgi:hypothetical protein